jgi:hypothetical protein
MQAMWIFGGPNLRELAEKGNPEGYWKHACLKRPVGSQLFRKLVNGFPGQGAIERENKEIKQHRTTIRNRQTHKVTNSYLELNSTYRIMRQRKSRVEGKMYLECIRDKIFEIEDDVEEEMREEAELNNQHVHSDDEVEDEEDQEYLEAAVDEGRNALRFLMEAAIEAARADADDALEY